LLPTTDAGIVKVKLSTKGNIRVSMKNPTIRLATTNDARAISKIYEPYCLDSPATFELQPASQIEIAERIAKVLTRFPYLVAEVDGEIVAYAYASQHKERAAYRFSADVSVYVRRDNIGRGRGKVLYAVLLPLLEAQGFRNALAGITLPNAGSVALHSKFGFVDVGVYKNIGYKLGKWHDVVWMQKVLGSYENQPIEPLKIAKILESAEFSYLVSK